MTKKIKYIKFLKFFLTIILLYLFYHAFIWTLYTSEIFDRNDKLYIGDIGRMSYQVDSLYPRKLEYTLDKKHLNHLNYKNESIDILTIGDSFSNAEMGGFNPYYQDYLATKYNKNVLNILKITDGAHTPFELVLSLYHNGWLDEYKPKAIIIQSSERSVYNRFAKKFDFNYKKYDSDFQIKDAKTKDSYIPELLMINTANYKLPYYTLKYYFETTAYKNVAKVTLNKDLFTTKNYENKLLFHYDDIKFMQNNPEKIMLINDNFNRLAALLKTLNIKLFFMPAVDKYDLYSDYIIGNPYPKNHFFDIIRPLKKNYYFIDTKKILLPYLQQGIKDIYYSDDTHWSYKASEFITEDKIFSENI